MDRVISRISRFSHSHLRRSVCRRRSSLPLLVSYVPFTFIDFADPVIGTNHCLPKAAWTGRCGSPLAGRIRVTRQQVRGIFNGMRLARISPMQRCGVNLNLTETVALLNLIISRDCETRFGSPPSTVSSFGNVSEKADEISNLTPPTPHARPPAESYPPPPPPPPLVVARSRRSR